MSDTFEKTVRNLLRMKPKPHKPAKGEEKEKADDQPKRTGRRPASRSESG